MRDHTSVRGTSENSDATMLMCALLLNTARKEGPSAFESFMKITNAESLRNAIYKAYSDVTTGTAV